MRHQRKARSLARGCIDSWFIHSFIHPDSSSSSSSFSWSTHRHGRHGRLQHLPPRLNGANRHAWTPAHWRPQPACWPKQYVISFPVEENCCISRMGRNGIVARRKKEEGWKVEMSAIDLEGRREFGREGEASHLAASSSACSCVRPFNGAGVTGAAPVPRSSLARSLLTR